MQAIENVGVVHVDRVGQGIWQTLLSARDGAHPLEHGSRGGQFFFFSTNFHFYMDHLDHLDQGKKINCFRGPGKKVQTRTTWTGHPGMALYDPPPTSL